MKNVNRLYPSFWIKLINKLRMAWLLFLDNRVPFRTKLILLAALLYLLSPLDFLPDFFLILGQVDDLAILILAIDLFINLSPEEVVKTYRKDI